MSKIEPSVIIKKLLMNILVPPKLAKRALAGHFGMEATSIDLTENLLLEYGRQCFEAGAGRPEEPYHVACRHCNQPASDPHLENCATIVLAE